MESSIIVIIVVSKRRKKVHWKFTQTQNRLDKSNIVTNVWEGPANFFCLYTSLSASIQPKCIIIYNEWIFKSFMYLQKNAQNQDS